ncbi:MAG: glycine dehydrogenase subunit 2 [Caldiserica bacterium]|nr:glycine dehydrogenase subunit 2 [Caldisericota bacterium]
MGTIYRVGQRGRQATSWPATRRSPEELLGHIPKGLRRREPPRLPEVSQGELVRHYTALSRMNHGVDTGFYPLGSCTMKYNPKLHEEIARLPGFTELHPLSPLESAQGVLEALWRLGELLKRIAGMPGITLQPAAGAHGELTGMLLIKRYFEDRGESERRRVILLPDSAHGTNPASAAMAGFRVIPVPSNEGGTVDLRALEELLGEEVAGIMMTVPNTLGIFERDILSITEMVHEVGGLCYFDGANLNAFLGRARPGDMGADIFHFNLHKTFSTPHGSGGPGAGPLTVSERLIPYLPVPQIVREGDRFVLSYDLPKSIGRVHPFLGNVLVMLKALAYILTLGDEGLREVSTGAVLAANYLRVRLREAYEIPYDGLCKHEFVASTVGLGVKARDVAKRLIDYGFHPPTVYFPLIVEEALMIEPTETETVETLDAFVEAMLRIAREAVENPEALAEAPHNAPVRRLDEVRAAREPILREEFPASTD